MDIRITNAEIKGEDTLVAFSCEFGEGKASWFGDAPETGRVYDAEMEFEDTLTWGKDILPSASNETRMEVTGDATRITARLESANEDGFAVIELGEDLYVLQTEGQIQPGDFVTFEARNITLYDTDVD